MEFGTEFLDVTSASLANPVRSDRAPRGTLPLPVDGMSNVERFKAAIRAALPAGYVPPRAHMAGGILGGILYLPPGRYLIENVLPAGWPESLNLLDSYDSAARTARVENPFGAALQFPAELTLWLAPDAVLVPAAGAIVHIQSALVCDPVQVFDLSFGGLVVFGERISKVLPEWWGVHPREDHAVAIQHAIDAGIHHRSSGWEEYRNPVDPQNPRPVTLFRYAPIPVELRGRYELHRSVEVRGGVTRSRVLDLLGERSIREVSRRTLPVTPTTIVGGVWQGRGSQGARLVAAPEFTGTTAGPALLRLIQTFGLTLRNVAFEVGRAMGPACLEITPSGTDAMQGVAVRGCLFEGDEATLVHVGLPPAIYREANVAERLPPVATLLSIGSDISGINFDECEFRPRMGGIGVKVRAQESVPFRFRGCSFTGQAQAMIVGWRGSFLVDDCSFENMAASPLKGPVVAGFPPLDGADIYLPYEPPTGDPQRTPPSPPVFSGGPLLAFTASACVSRSRRFVSTATSSEEPSIIQFARTPVVLLNTRHLPATASPGDIAIRWGLRAGVASFIGRHGDLLDARIGVGAPLVIVGGQYAGGLKVFRLASQCAVVGARSLWGGVLDVDFTDYNRTGVSHFGAVFGMLFDQRLTP